VEWNPAFAKMLGFSEKELGRSNVKDWDIKLSNDEIEKITNNLSLEHLNIETQHRRKDGTVYDAEVSISGVEWAGQHYLFCLHRDITARKQTELALRESEARFRAIIEASPIPYALNDDQRNVTYLNASFIKAFGYTLGDIPHLSDWWSKAYPDDEYRHAIVATWRAHMEKAEQESQPFEPVEAEILCKNGERRTALVAAEPLNESLRGLHVVSFFDITARKQAEEEHRLAATVFSHAREGILITNADGTILDVNQMFSQITGYGREEVVGKTPHLLSSGRHEKSFYEAMWNELTENGNWAGEIFNRRKDGEIFPEMLTISAVRDPQGKTQQYVALFSDITDIKNHEHQLEHMAHYDVLTKLPNRALLGDRLQQAMSQTVRRKQVVTVCYLDLDGFKAINDKHGHGVGDQLLVVLAVMMREVLRETDTLARIGGDEFVAILTDLTDEETSLLTIERLIHTACQPVQLGDLVLQISASLGATFYPQAEAVDADQLLRQADHAMYQAKLTGKNRYCVFEEPLSSESCG
jgi:diguanylate cyclase (GGDEF)-like protein/PAS domain S-box-containing protein